MTISATNWRLLQHQCDHAGDIKCQMWTMRDRNIHASTICHQWELPLKYCLTCLTCQTEFSCRPTSLQYHSLKKTTVKSLCPQQHKNSYYLHDCFDWRSRADHKGILWLLVTHLVDQKTKKTLLPWGKVQMTGGNFLGSLWDWILKNGMNPIRPSLLCDSSAK